MMLKVEIIALLNCSGINRTWTRIIHIIRISIASRVSNSVIYMYFYIICETGDKPTLDGYLRNKVVCALGIKRSHEGRLGWTVVDEAKCGFIGEFYTRAPTAY